MEYAQTHGILTTPGTISDETLSDFEAALKQRENIDEYLDDYGLAMSDSLLDANAEFLKRGLRRELARRTEGQQAAYRVAIEADTQLHEVLALFDEARTLTRAAEAGRGVEPLPD